MVRGVGSRRYILNRKISKSLNFQVVLVSDCVWPRRAPCFRTLFPLLNRPQIPALFQVHDPLKKSLPNYYNLVMMFAVFGSLNDLSLNFYDHKTYRLFDLPQIHAACILRISWALRASSINPRAS